MAIQALLLADGSEALDWLKSRLGEGVVILPADATTTAACVAEVEATPDLALVFVEFDADSAPMRAQTVEALVEAYPSMPVVALGREDAGDMVLAAMRAGARDFFVSGRDDDRIGTLLQRVLAPRNQPRPRQDSEGASGHIVTVFSSAQSPLLAFLGGHISFVLASRGTRAQRILLLDLTLPGGNAVIMFDGAQDYTAVDILEDVERCDEALVDSAFQKLQQGVYLLALPESFNGSQFDSESPQLGRLLEIFRRIFDHVVICADRGLHLSNLATLVGSSDHALLMSDQSVLRSRQNKVMLQQLREMDTPLARTKLVIVNYRSDIGMEAQQLADLLDLPLAATIGGRSTARMKAMNAGESMFEYAPSDGFTKGVQALASQVLGVQPPAKRHSGTWHLFGWGPQ
ncbi:AAA family ATPase [Salinisphaera aquimarina]|uniref:CpaE family protein n=1 Tax=Salinisphaera aquimarina TaxID=2094031 RepID=A0ABV7EWS0_9GAMM